MRYIVSIVEGHGHFDALPILLQKLNDWEQHPAVDFWARRLNAKGLSNLTKPNGLEGFLEIARGIARLEDQCDGVLVLLDAEADCPLELASGLAQRAR